MWPPRRKDSARTMSADAQPMGSVFKFALGGNESIYDAVPQPQTKGRVCAGSVYPPPCPTMTRLTGTKPSHGLEPAGPAASWPRLRFASLLSLRMTWVPGCRTTSPDRLLTRAALFTHVPPQPHPFGRGSVCRCSAHSGSSYTDIGWPSLVVTTGKLPRWAVATASLRVECLRRQR